MSVSSESPPHLSIAGIHPANGDIGGVEEIGREAGGAEDAWQFRAIMQRCANRFVSAASKVGVALRDKKLAASCA